MWYAAVQTAIAGPSIWGQVRAASATNGRTKRAVTLPSSNMTKFQRSSGRGGNFDFAGGEKESGGGKADVGAGARHEKKPHSCEKHKTAGRRDYNQGGAHRGCLGVFRPR